MNVQGVDVHVTDTGSGQPVLFLHGNPDSADVWDAVTAELQSDFRCICIDLPGFGRSRAPADFDCSVENLGRFVNGVVEALAIDEPIDLVAHDFGGAFASAFAIANPDKVRRIVHINHPFFVANYKWHFWARIWRTPILGELSIPLTNWPIFYWSIKPGSRQLSKAQIRAQYSGFTVPTRRMVLKLYRAVGPREFEEWGKKTLELASRIPTLALWGEHDIYIPQWVADGFGADQVIRFDDSGHWAPAEVPDKVAAAIRTHLSL